MSPVSRNMFENHSAFQSITSKLYWWAEWQCYEIQSLNYGSGATCYIPVSRIWKRQKSEGKLELLQCAFECTWVKGREGNEMNADHRDKTKTKKTKCKIHLMKCLSTKSLMFLGFPSHIVLLNKCTLSSQFKRSHSTSHEADLTL